MAGGMDKIVPKSMAFPKSTFMVAAAADMPGCGGTRQCTAYKAVAKHTTNCTCIPLVRCTSDSTKPINTINPESQKMGSPMRKPMSVTASGVFFSPVFFKIKLASDRVALLLFKSVPKVVPKMISKPIFSSVAPKPFFIKLMTFSPSNPAAKPTVIATTSSTKKVLYLYFALNRMMAMMAAASRVVT